jgi:hypothetical protein
MISDHWQLLEAFRNDAYALLQNANAAISHLESESYMRVIQILILPTFDNPHSYTVFSKIDDQLNPDYLCVKQVWDMRSDMSIFADPVNTPRMKILSSHGELVPTIRNEVIHLSDSEPLKLINGLEQLRIPPAADKSTITLDGVRYRVILGKDTEERTFEWNTECPAERSVFERLVNSLIELAENQSEV